MKYTYLNFHQATQKKILEKIEKQYRKMLEIW